MQVNSGQRHHWLIVASGTGGHVFPGLAVAEAARQQQITIDWVGTDLPHVKKWVTAQSIPYTTIRFHGMRRTRLSNWLCLPFTFTRAVVESIKILRQMKPTLVLCMGGFVSLPMGFAARLCGCKLALHEQNAIAGRANRLLAKIADVVMLGFKSTDLKGKICHFVGNPVRQTIQTNDKDKSDTQKNCRDDNQALSILVIGGSGGARAINQLLLSLYQLLASAQHYVQSPRETPVLDATRLRFTHQTGNALYEETLAAWQSMTPQQDGHPMVNIVPFIDDMAEALQAADMVISRAGALSVSEILQVGVPALFIPYPYAVDDHQTANAASIVSVGGGVCLQQSELDADRLQAVIANEFLPVEKWQKKVKALKLHRPKNPTDSIIRLLLTPTIPN